jgi:uncharacterized repeat protein (TIGR01451 family)
MNKTAGTILVMASMSVVLVLILILGGGSLTQTNLAQATDGGPNLAIFQDDGVGAVRAGNTLTYTITVTNTGTAIATGIVITDTVSAHTTVDPDANPRWFCDGDGVDIINTGGNNIDFIDTCTFAISPLDISGAISITLVVDVDAQLPVTVTRIVNMAEVADDGENGSDPDPDNNIDIISTPVLMVDIKPGSDPNSINCTNERGVIAVAILTTEDFDATTVDHTTVIFEGASETHVDKKTGEPRRHEEDVDGDGDVDLIFHFRLDDTNLICNSTEGILTGETFHGQSIEGVDSVRMVHRDS